MFYDMFIMKKIILIIIAGIMLAAPAASFAAENKFFEFATDVGVPIAVPTGSVAIQEFKIYNDHVSAADVWFDNSGSSGSATVALLDAANTVLTSASVTIAHSDPFYAGQQLHVSFSKTVTVTSGAWYKLKITSATPQLRLYAIKRVQFVEHNAPYPIDSAIGASFLDSDSLFSVFKFALYESSDTTAPIITNASTTFKGPDTTVIAFNASELADRSLSYTPIGSGAVTTIGFTGSYAICFEGVFACPITINTQQGTSYTYRLTVRDMWGNASYADGAFTSWSPISQPTPDVTPQPAPQPDQPQTSQQPAQQPVAQALAITGARIVSVSGQSVTILWNTDRAANGTVIVSSDPVGARVIANTADNTYELVHTITTGNNLTANTGYYATIISRDAAGIMAAQVIPFTTAKASVVQEQPTPTPLPQLRVTQNGQTASFAWGVPAGGEPSGGYRVDVIDGKGNLFRTLRVPTGTHSVEVLGLADGEYHAIAYADHGGVVEKIAVPAAVAVRAHADSIDTYALIRKPIVFIPSGLFVLLVAGLYWYSKRQKKSMFK